MANNFRRSGSIPSVSLANGYSGIPVLGIEVTLPLTMILIVQRWLPTRVAYAKPHADDAASGSHNVELHVFDGAGNLLFTHTLHISYGGCGDEVNDHSGMMQEDVSYQVGMKEIALFINGEEKSRFVAGELGLTRGMNIEMGRPKADAPHRRAITAPPSATQSGLTYTVQARSEGEKAWQTIAVGRERPDGEVNMNQFPRAKKVNVRVLVTNGFEEDILAEQEMTSGQ